MAISSCHGSKVHWGLDDIDDPLQIYLREIDKIPALTADEEIDLLERMRMQDEQGELARKSLVEAHLHLVVSIARRYPSAGIHVLDLVVKGNEALMHSLTTFAGSGESFSAHAAVCIERAILDAIGESATDRPRRG
jgi:RNA polymerase primary sigma factor